MKLSRVDASIQFFNRRFRSKVEREFEADIKIEIEFLAYVTKKKKLPIKSSKSLHKVLSNYANFELIRKLEGEKSVPNIIIDHCTIQAHNKISSTVFVVHIEIRAKCSVECYSRDVFIDFRPATNVQQTTFDRVRTINAPSPSTL